jgi:hypothetical protein
MRRRVKGMDQSERGSLRSLASYSTFIESPNRDESMGLHTCYDCQEGFVSSLKYLA